MEHPDDDTGEDAVAELEPDPGSQPNSTSSKTNEQNPYAVGTSTELSEFAWSDGDVRFTRKEIRVTGDTVLPRICVKTGSTENLTERVTKLSAVTPAYKLLSRLAFPVLLAVMFLPVWLDQLAFLEGQQWLFIAAAFGIGFSQIWIGRNVTVTWYMERDAAKKEERRQRWLPAFRFIAVLGLLAILWITDIQWLLLPILVIALVDGLGDSITARSHYNGRFVLVGHSTEFVEAWADQVALKSSAAPSSS